MKEKLSNVQFAIIQDLRSTKTVQKMYKGRYCDKCNCIIVKLDNNNICDCKERIWISGHYTTKIIRDKKVRVWESGYYKYIEKQHKKEWSI